MKTNIEKTLNHLATKEILYDYRKEVGLENSIEELPISPSMIKDDATPVIFTDEVTRNYNLIVELLKESYSSLDFPFVLLGNRKKVNGSDTVIIEKFGFCCDEITSFSTRKINYNDKILTSYLLDDNYDIVSIGRSHGTLTKRKEEKSVVSKLSDDFKEKYDIRCNGHNLYLEDLLQQEDISDIELALGKEIYTTIIMPTGEITIIGVNDKEYTKFENVDAKTSSNEIVSLPVRNFDTRFEQGMSKEKK